ISKEVVDAAIDSLGDGGGRARDAKTFLLVEIGPMVAPLIADRLFSPKGRLRDAAAKALSDIGPRPEYDSLPQLLKALAAADTCRERIPLVRTLASFGDKRALEPLQAEVDKGTDYPKPNFCMKKVLPAAIEAIEKASATADAPAPK